MAKSKKKVKVGLWSDSEIKLLKKLYRNTSNRDIARQLKRGVEAVRIKGGRLGLCKTKKYLKSMGLA